MKKTLRFAAVLIAVSVLSSFCLAAGAAPGNPVLLPDSEMKADLLYGLGLLRGTTAGYELEKDATRVQAAVMCVRLLGMEDEALAGDYSHPFTDVPSWADGYIGYMYENGLTNGATATTFDPDGKCTRQMYDAFMLRVLGYSEQAGDYTYAGVVDFADQLGLNGFIISDSFLRGDMVSVSYAALLTPFKSESDTFLLARLSEEGSVNQAESQRILSILDVYQDYMEEGKSFASDDQAVAMDFDMDFSYAQTAAEESTEVNFNMTGGMAVITGDGDLTFTMNADVTMQDEATSMSTSIDMYCADGWLYMDAAGDKVKMELPLDYQDLIAQTESAEPMLNQVPVYMIESMTKTTSGAAATYTIVFEEDIFDSLTGAMSAMGETGVSFAADTMTLSITLTGDTKMDIAMDIDGSMEMMGNTVDFSASFDMDFEITATGDDVVITPPADLDEYRDIIGYYYPEAA